ncbi:MAG: SemiSWEET transporter [Ignavibacteriales bacterium]|nr:Sugar transporter SemiSWEET [Ignavibacteriaceae bacterium]MCK6614756.1 SemiSWEET transporter [Ignavibacteriaceae bacterium]QOJ27620.1 MAG: SemiSWEET transporter [Ignavibacteriales bacterium]
MTELIGYAAAFCTTIAFLPQAVKVYKTRHTKDISLGMFLLLTTGVVLWLTYGIIINSYPIIAANTVTLLFDIYILYMKITLDKG